MISFIPIENCPKSIIKIKNKEGRRVGRVDLLVQDVYNLRQEQVMEINEGVVSFVAVLKEEWGGVSREATQW